MFHLFYLYKASTMLMLSNRNATMIKETQEFQHPRNRLLYDILVDTTIKMHKSADFKSLVISILHYVKTLPQDMLEWSSHMPIEIKQLIIDSAIKTYGCVDRISSKEYKEDDSDHYKTLVKLCFDIREYDLETVILSTQKEFSEYKLEDYAINLATSHIALSQARYSYEFITSLRDQDKWTEDDAKHFEKITNCSTSYAKVAADTLHNYFEYYDYDLDALSKTELNFEILLEQLQLIEKFNKKDRSVLFICYSTTEILDFVEKKMEKIARNGETYKTCLEAINDSDLGSFFEKWKEVDSSKIPIIRDFCRDMTKYEMLISCKRPIVDEETLKEWQKSIENITCRIAEIFGYLESHWFKIAENDENKEEANDATPSTS